MSLSLTLACLWVLAAAATAMLPMRLQYAPGLTLLILTVPLLSYIAVQHGTLVVLLVLAGVISMFRRPVWYLSRRAVRLLTGAGA